jgi:hypothetical protein
MGKKGKREMSFERQLKSTTPGVVLFASPSGAVASSGTMLRRQQLRQRTTRVTMTTTATPKKMMTMVNKQEWD